MVNYKRILLIMILTMALAVPGWATIYYVDSSITDTHVASATPDFTTYNPTTFATTGGSASVYKTIADINACTFAAGDQILFRKGQTWREQLTVPSSGSAGNPITFGAYDAGADPVITGADILGTSGWTNSSGAEVVYQKALTTDPGNYVLEDSSLLTKQTSIANVDANAGSYYWASNVIYVNATGASKDPTSNGKIYETPIRSTVVTCNNLDYITLSNLSIQMAQGSSGILLNIGHSDYSIVDNCSLKYSNQFGVWMWEGDTPGKTSDVSILNNVFNYMPYGVWFSGDDWIFTGNTFQYGNVGIQMTDTNNQKCLDFIITGNTFSNLGVTSSVVGYGVLLEGDTTGDNSDYHRGQILRNAFNNIAGRPIDGFYGNTTIANNIINTVTDGGGSSGIGIEVNGPNNAIYNNVVYNASNIGIMINNDPIAPNVQSVVKNNIISGNSSHIIWVSNDAGLAPAIDYNCFWPGAGATKYYWKGTDYTFTNWKSNSSQDAHSLEADPLMVDPSGGDFTLQAGSPCKRAGTWVGLTSDYVGKPIYNEPGISIGAYQYWKDVIITPEHGSNP